MEHKELIDVATRIAAKLVKPFEGCVLKSYPDPASPLSKALALHGMLNKYIAGKIELPDNFKNLSGIPWTIGYGETKGVTAGMTWTQEKADKVFAERIREFALDVLVAAPELEHQSPEKLAACTSLAYNIGINAFKNSTVNKMIAKRDWLAAGQAFKMWNKAQGQIMQGLVRRRQAECDLFLSVKD